MAVEVQDSIESKLIEVAGEALMAFGDDISTMFGVEVVSTLKQQSQAKVDSLKKLFKKVCAVHAVRAEGALNGTFYLVFDQAGLFTLSGVVVMLPEARIREEAKRGTATEAQAMSDAVGEVGNLLVGSWDRVFREGWPGHKHFVKGNTLIGLPWDSAQESLGVSAGEELSLAVYEMTLASYPPFSFAVLFSKDLWESKPTPVEAKPSDGKAQPEEVAQAEPAATSTPEPAAVAEPVTPESTPAAAEIPGELMVEVTNQPAPAVEVQTDSPEVVVSAPVSPSVSQAVISGGPETAGLLGVKVEALMSRSPAWVSPEDSVLDVLRSMQQRDVGYVLVGRNGVLEGIVSRSTVLGAISPYLRPVFARWRRPEDDATLNIKIKWAMSRPVQTVTSHATLGQAIERMQQFGGRCLPVTAPDGKVVGLLTVFDIFRAMDPSKPAGHPPQAPCLMA